MLKRIQVNGFRSLMGFSVGVRPGVNILLGPNGSGKSNIVMFLAFVSAVFERRSASKAVSDFGGAGRIFSRTGKRNPVMRIDAEFIGEGVIHTYKMKGGGVSSKYRYEYRFAINFSKEIQTVYFENQEFKFAFCGTPQNSRGRNNSDWDFHIREFASIVGKKIEFNHEIQKMNIDMLGSSTSIILYAENEKKKNIERAISQIIQSTHQPNAPILYAASLCFPKFNGVISDLSQNKVLNIVPEIAKNSDDSATPPEIEVNGKGLAATLYALELEKNDMGIQSNIEENASLSNFEKYGRPHNYRIADAFDMIEESLKSISDNIISIQPEIDHLKNEITIYVKLKMNGGKVKFPLSHLSDGTVKWLALVTSIYTNRSIIAIEEPENYIHPLMQRKILDLIRNNLRAAGNNGKPRGSMFLTTHSETLLNSADPSEIVLVSMTNSGATRTRRIKRMKDIRDAANEDGFGLGHLYLSGVLDYV